MAGLVWLQWWYYDRLVIVAGQISDYNIQDLLAARVVLHSLAQGRVYRQQRGNIQIIPVTRDNYPSCRVNIEEGL